MTENEFYEKLKETVQEKMGDIPVELLKSVKNNNITCSTSGGFYIIPSSIHELLLMPDTKRINEEMVRKTIFQINREHVEPEERLSDSLYHYDGQKLSIIGKEGGEDE